MLKTLITTLVIMTFGLSLTAQNQKSTEDATKEMDKAMSEMSKMMDTLDFSKLLNDEGLQEMMKGLDLGQMNLDSLMGGGIPSLEGMEGQDFQKMMEQSMKMFETMDMTELSKMLEGMDLENMLQGMDLEKMLEGMDLEKMLEGMDFGEMMPKETPKDAPVEKDGKKLKKI